MYYFYQIKYWDEKTEEKEDSGIVYGKDLGEAANKVGYDYGADDVLFISLYPIFSCDALSFEELERYKEDLFGAKE